MVRAGIVNHQSQWLFCGYHEIQNPRRKNVLIDYAKLTELVGAETYDQVKHYSKGRVKEYLGGGNNRQEDKWTKRIGACPVKCLSFI
jgi:putative transposase